METLEATKKTYYRRTTCRFCGSKDLECVMHLAPTPIADAYLPKERLHERQEVFPLDLFLCGQCGLVHLPDVVDPEYIYRQYNYETTTSPGLPEHFQHYADSVIKRLDLAKGSFVVEIGSNDGTLLKCFQKSGMRVLGVDPATNIAQRATAAGVETWPEFFTEDIAHKIKEEKGSPLLIIANNVMANIDDLDSLMRGICQLLAQDGVYIFESGYLVDTVRNMVFDNIYHEHISYLSAKPLKTFFEKYNMEMVHIERVVTKGGSIRGTVQFKKGAREIDGSVNEFIGFEEKIGIYDPQMFKNFAQNIDREKRTLNDFLKEASAQGKTIAGYGASHSVTTFLHYFGIGKMLTFIVDDNPGKYHTFSPTDHIPVYPSEELVKRKPDYVVILAWRFFDRITQKHQSYLDQGGEFIVPLPKFHIKSKSEI